MPSSPCLFSIPHPERIHDCPHHLHVGLTRDDCLHDLAPYRRIMGSKHRDALHTLPVLRCTEAYVPPSAGTIDRGCSSGSSARQKKGRVAIDLPVQGQSTEGVARDRVHAKKRQVCNGTLHTPPSICYCSRRPRTRRPRLWSPCASGAHALCGVSPRRTGVAP